MKRFFKRTIACLIAVLMVVSSLPFTAITASAQTESTNSTIKASSYGIFKGSTVDRKYDPLQICNDAEDKSAGNRGEGNLSEAYNKSADSADEDNSNNKEVLVFAEVNSLNHLETAYRDKAVERDANAAHYAVRNACKEGYERTEEGDNETHYRSRQNGNDRCVFGDRDTSDGFAVSRVRASAEYCARN